MKHYLTNKKVVLRALFLSLAIAVISCTFVTIFLYINTDTLDKFYEGAAFGTTLSAIIPLFTAFPSLLVFLAQAEEMKDVNSKLATILRFDSLTNLLTRRTFFSDARLKLAQTPKGSNSPSAMLFIDIDHFKKVNDVFGHKIGDRVLTQLGKVVNKHTPDGAICGRLGGEEFAILLTNASSAQVENIAQKIAKVFKQQALIIEDLPVRATLSIGIYLFKDETNIDNLLNKADNMLYHAKNQGRDQVQTSYSASIAA